MPRGAPPQWTQKKPPYTHSHVEQSVSGGMNPQTGHYAELIYDGIEDEERALEIKRSLYRCAGHMGYSMKADIEPMGGGKWQVRFKAIDKAIARAYVRKTYGHDMPYNPYAPNPPKE